MLVAEMKTMHADAFHIDGYPFVSPVETVEHMKSYLPAVTRSKIGDPEVETKIDAGESLEKTHCEVNEGENLKILEHGYLIGLERLLGAILISGAERFTITCAEIYSRDNLIDPHAEPYDADPSSFPTNDATVQYRGFLKIMYMTEKFNKKKL
jgi:hypothetical protein